MIQRTKHAHTNYTMVKPFVEQVEKMGGAIRCKSSGYMDLVIENAEYNDCYGNPVYSVAHYGKQNGDLMRDPEMTFSINHDAETIIPLSFRNDYMGHEREVIRWINGRQMYSVSLLRDLDSFLWTWLKNIGNQGFEPERAESIS